MTTLDPKRLQSSTARKALAPQTKPYKTSLGIGVTLGYYRPVTLPGSWKAILAVPGGAQQVINLGRADDTVAADGAAVLSYAEARRAAEKLASERGKAIAAAPVTIEEALTRYAADLRRRGGNPANAATIRHHIGEAFAYLLALPLPSVTSTQLKCWGDAVLDRGTKPATYNRLMKAVHAAFNAVMEARGNAAAWKDGLRFVAGATTARKVFLTDAEVRALVSNAYDLGVAGFGEWIQAHAELGSRSDQIARITVGDLRGDFVRVPNSGKGNVRTKRKSTSGKTDLALTADLATRLAALAAGRHPDDLLLVDPVGRSWTSDAGKSRSQWLFAKVLQGPAKVPQGISLIAFRHSSIQRAIGNMARTGATIADIARAHNTSMRQIEDHYSRGMDATAIERMRATLLETGPAKAPLTLRVVA